MFPVLQNPLAFLARALIALLFIPAGIAKIIGFMGTMGYIAAMGVPFPAVAAVIAIVVELGLGLLLLAGYQTRWSAMVLAFFTLVITLIFHPFWGIPAEMVMSQQQAFFKNIAIVGGLLGIAAFGAGAWSLDAKAGR
jgi:putative oxidoreductase